MPAASLACVVVFEEEVNLRARGFTETTAGVHEKVGEARREAEVEAVAFLSLQEGCPAARLQGRVGPWTALHRSAQALGTLPPMPHPARMTFLGPRPCQALGQLLALHLAKAPGMSPSDAKH